MNINVPGDAVVCDEAVERRLTKSWVIDERSFAFLQSSKSKVCRFRRRKKKNTPLSPSNTLSSSFQKKGNAFSPSRARHVSLCAGPSFVLCMLFKLKMQRTKPNRGKASVPQLEGAYQLCSASPPPHSLWQLRGFRSSFAALC